MQKPGQRYEPTAEADAGAGKVLIWEEGITGDVLIWNVPTEALTQGLAQGREVRTTKHLPGTTRHQYLESLVDDAGSAWRASGVVVQLLLQAAQQAAEVRWGVVGLSSSIVDGAESFRIQTQLPETLLEETIC